MLNMAASAYTWRWDHCAV